MADPLTVFAIGDIDELGIRGVVLRGSEPAAIREAGTHLQEPVVIVPVEQWRQVVEALRLTAGALQAGQSTMARRVAFTGEWAHLGTRSVSDILDSADAALASLGTGEAV